MTQPKNEDDLLKRNLLSAKVIAMVGISSIKKENASAIVRRPSIIVMSYLQEFGYKVIPVNPFSAGKKVNGELILEKIEDIKDQIDVVNVFRPSSEAPTMAKKAIQVKAKVLWLQFGIQNEEAKQIVEKKNITYVANKCIKQEYQRLFLKMSPVFPALK